MSILPERDNAGKLAPWAQQFRDGNAHWAQVAQEGVSAFRNLVMKQSMPFAFETVFSYWQLQDDGTYASKADNIIAMQAAGYFVVLLFVGLTSPQLSVPASRRASSRADTTCHSRASLSASRERRRAWVTPRPSRT